MEPFKGGGPLVHRDYGPILDTLHIDNELPLDKHAMTAGSGLGMDEDLHGTHSQEDATSSYAYSHFPSRSTNHGSLGPFDDGATV